MKLFGSKDLVLTDPILFLWNGLSQRNYTNMLNNISRNIIVLQMD
jgi:hypothetical protein